ncbi:cation:proton antiporter [Halorhodospira neutriphila]|uniref:Sodium:proton antiporter n=1 Tax=Halorhodospira neutriphila TaxID=168379 RepID=A0ABS1E677_9GAMM|nr:cation:proton antiporter [Halorhodospira neutriphila]MBK1726463.1 sodium:proton antiporter [Halorhodospira neutriphila]
MADLGVIITTLGVLILLGLVGDLLSHRLPLPRVTLLVLFGVAIGPPGLDLLPEVADQWYPFISNLALLMVGFLLGSKLSLANLRHVGRHVLGVSLFEVLGASLLVLLALWLAGAPPALALILAGIAPASAPAAVTNVVEEAQAEGKFTDTLLGIVALDDAWGLIVFSLLLAVAQSLGGDGSAWAALLHGGRELGGALLLGLAIGVPAAFVTGRLKPGQPTQAEAIGVVLLAGGLALLLEVSFLLTAMVVGATIVNLAAHYERPFAEIQYIEWPFMILFFLLAGASLHLGELAQIGLIGGAYVLARALGLILGAYAGGRISGAPARVRRWMGLAIMPQAGVALGMALVAANAFPALQERIVTLVVGSTVLFELLGPVLTRTALVRSGEWGRGKGAAASE